MLKKIVLILGVSFLIAISIVGMIGKTAEDKQKERAKALSENVIAEETQEGIETVLEEDRKNRDYNEENGESYETEVKGIQDSFEYATNNLTPIDKKVIEMTTDKSVLFLYDKTKSKFAVNDNAHDSEIGVLAKNTSNYVSGRTNKGSANIGLLNFRDVNVVVKSVYIEDVVNGNIPFEYDFDKVIHKNETAELFTSFDLLSTYDIGEVEKADIVIEIESEDGTIQDKIIVNSTIE